MRGQPGASIALHVPLMWLLKVRRDLRPAAERPLVSNGLLPLLWVFRDVYRSSGPNAAQMAGRQ